MTTTETRRRASAPRRSTAPAWIAVILMCLGAALLAGGVVAVSLDTTVAVGCFAAGVVIGLAGVVGAVRGKIMDDVE